MVEPTVRIICAQGRASENHKLNGLFRRAELVVQEAATAADLHRQAATLPDLIILDDSLPDQSARGVLRDLRANPTTACLPVLFLDGDRGGEQGDWDGYLAANAEPDEILAWARALLRRPDGPRMESLGRLASGIAHDFNNLLTVVLGHADLLSSCLPAEDSGRELLAGLQSAGQTAAGLAAQLLTLAKQKPLPAQPIDLNGLINQIAGLLRRVFDTRIEFVIEMDSIPVVHAVPSQLTQVLLNLCLNARDAMTKGGRLTVRTETVLLPAGQFVRLRVMDTGPGIAPELLPRIFEPFFTTRPGEGSGLGLSTVQRIVCQHQGWIECHSEIGSGSCFDVYLPPAGATEAA